VSIFISEQDDIGIPACFFSVAGEGTTLPDFDATSQAERHFLVDLQWSHRQSVSVNDT
jgi:hypothetical protein